ncbi:hypothetical protein M3226_26830 [Neobacillus cucumis]|uniref:hypothetical protein n=1 Tax=Neobacillus cucumis TaxID=1740721 RepID=UPI0020424AED|nr:hypothetical protein [Neobacillus cucumis]MCM3729225.1 hypothetical protein [Neobacillus cucumis]
MVTKAAGLGCFGIHVESRGANVESASKRVEFRGINVELAQSYRIPTPICIFSTL